MVPCGGRALAAGAVTLGVLEPGGAVGFDVAVGAVGSSYSGGGMAGRPWCPAHPPSANTMAHATTGAMVANNMEVHLMR
jgi:hypothetical protein